MTVCSAVPASSSAYVLARQMGGDAPLLVQIITLQAILAAITMPIANRAGRDWVLELKADYKQEQDVDS